MVLAIAVSSSSGWHFDLKLTVSAHVNSPLLCYASVAYCIAAQEPQGSVTGETTKSKQMLHFSSCHQSCVEVLPRCTAQTVLGVKHWTQEQLQPLEILGAHLFLNVFMYFRHVCLPVRLGAKQLRHHWLWVAIQLMPRAGHELFHPDCRSTKSTNCSEVNSKCPEHSLLICASIAISRFSCCPEQSWQGLADSDAWILKGLMHLWIKHIITVSPLSPEGKGLSHTGQLGRSVIGRFSSEGKIQLCIKQNHPRWESERRTEAKREILEIVCV